MVGRWYCLWPKDPSARLLKHVVRCYLRLSDNPRSNVYLHLFGGRVKNYFLKTTLSSLDRDLNRHLPVIGSLVYDETGALDHVATKAGNNDLLMAGRRAEVYRAREALRQCLPDQLRDSTFSTCLQDDKSTKHWLSQLLKNLETGQVTVGDPRSVGISPLTPQTHMSIVSND
uniref:CCR4-NOT transcription complex subunit 9 n=1 Tax=Timema californicum TaxID=61474 RepID=A0A7R9J7P3_TIMCA|nr:unnamed protein product [Timema californicum]